MSALVFKHIGWLLAGWLPVIIMLIIHLRQVENYLMLSEYEQNLIKETEGPPGPGRRARKWSLVRQASNLLQAEDGTGAPRRRDFSLFRAGLRMNTIMED